MFIACSLVAYVSAATPELFVPKDKVTQIILRPADNTEKNYYLTPNLVRINHHEILITIKRGTSHGWEQEADAGMLRFDTVANKIIDSRIIGHIPQKKFQLTMGTVLGDGTLAMFTDLQTTGDDGRHYRAGMRFTRSRDAGATFEPWRAFPLIAGVEYGYPFDFIVEGHTVFMLAMTFGYRPGERWSVDVVKSPDDGKTWSFVRNLKAEFGGFPINESGFARFERGFIVATRGYDHTARLQRTDADFKLEQQVDLVKTCPYVNDYIGWPRVFTRDGRYYLLGRNWTKKPAQAITARASNFPSMADNQQLCLLRFDPRTLAIDRVVVLDNADGTMPVVDGYYGVPYWQERDGRTRFNVISYRAVGVAQPDIIRLEFDWNEVR